MNFTHQTVRTTEYLKLGPGSEGIMETFPQSLAPYAGLMELRPWNAPNEAGSNTAPTRPSLTDEVIMQLIEENRIALEKLAKY